MSGHSIGCSLFFNLRFLKVATHTFAGKSSSPECRLSVWEEQHLCPPPERYKKHCLCAFSPHRQHILPLEHQPQIYNACASNNLHQLLVVQLPFVGENSVDRGLYLHPLPHIGRPPEQYRANPFKMQLATTESAEKKRAAFMALWIRIYLQSREGSYVCHPLHNLCLLKI